MAMGAKRLVPITGRIDCSDWEGKERIKIFAIDETGVKVGGC
jgi:hypothetical protein